VQLELIEKLADENLAELWVGRLLDDSGRSLVTVRRLLRAVASAPGVLEGLRAASAAVSGLAHPCILPHVAFVEAGGDHYWISQRVEGFDLATALNRLSSREVHISPLRTLKIGEDFLAGLAALHEAGQVHGGLDPRHVLVGADGLSRLDGVGYESVLMGIKELKQKARRGRRETLPPEVINGRGGSTQADVFSAAAILYRLLTGQPPLGAGDGGSVSTRHQAIQPPSKLDRSLPFSCDAVFVKALGTAPHSRHENGAALQRAVAQLRRAMSEGPDEGQAGVIEFVRSLFPNEAVVAGMPGTLERPAKGEPIPLAGPAVGARLPSLASLPEEPTQPASPAQPAAPPPAPPPLPSRATQAAPARAWSAEFEAPPVPLAQPAAGSPAPPATSTQPLDRGFAQGEGTDEEDAPVRDTQVMPVVSVDEPAPPAEVTPPKHDTRELKAAGARPAWSKPTVLLAGGLLALVVALVLYFGFGSVPEEPALGPPSGPSSPIGFLSIDSDVPAQITLDGELLPGTTPLVKKLLRAGMHRVVLTLPNGQKLFDEQVEVTIGGTRELHAGAPAADAGLLEARPAPPAPKPPPPKKKPSRKRTQKLRVTKRPP